MEIMRKENIRFVQFSYNMDIFRELTFCAMPALFLDIKALLQIIHFQLWVMRLRNIFVAYHDAVSSEWYHLLFAAISKKAFAHPGNVGALWLFCVAVLKRLCICLYFLPVYNFFVCGNWTAFFVCWVVSGCSE